MGAVDHDAQAVQREFARQRALGEFNVVLRRRAFGARVGRFRQPLAEIAIHDRFDLELDLVGHSRRPEQLDAVVVKVGGGEIITPDQRRIDASAWPPPASASGRWRRPCRPR